jgi:hypothetical protein
MRTQSARNRVAATRPTSRPRITNRTGLLENLDGRSSSARPFRDLVRAYEAELGGELRVGTTRKRQSQHYQQVVRLTKSAPES